MIFSLLSLNAVDVDSSKFDFSGDHKSAVSVKLIVGVVTGSLALVGVAALVVAITIYTKRGKRNYEKLPLLADE